MERCFPVKFSNFCTFFIPFLQNKQLFYRTPPDNWFCFYLFLVTFKKWCTATSVFKTSNEYFYLETLTIEVQFRCTFLSQQHQFSMYAFIGLHCLLTEAATGVQSWAKNLENFLLSSTIRLHHKWNGTRLLWPESQCTSCIYELLNNLRLSELRLKT